MNKMDNSVINDTIKIPGIGSTLKIGNPAKKDLCITVSGPTGVGKSAFLGLLKIIFDELQGPNGETLEVVVDPVSQTIEEQGKLPSLEQINTILNTVVKQNSVRIVLSDKSDVRSH